MGRFCLYADNPIDAPCVSIKVRKYSYLPDFLVNSPRDRSIKSFSVPILVDCLKLEDDTYKIDDYKCFNCMFCAFGCIGNKVLINSNLHPTDMCAEITRETVNKMREELFPKLFNGEFISLPPVSTSHIRVKYKSFEEFTSTNETKHIAVWGANAMKFLSTSLEPRVALEVGVDIQNRDRAGRLDISLLNTNDNYLFVAETKVSFEAMMAESRYEAQLLGYESVLEKSCNESIRRCKFLLIGGKESDLLPSNNLSSTGGIKSDLFYDVLRERGFFFISANALLVLGLMKMYVSNSIYNLENFYQLITNPEFVGLLSAGVVHRNGAIIPLSKLDFLE